MNIHDQRESPPGVVKPEGDFYRDNLPEEDVPEKNASPNTAASWVTEIEQTLQLGEQFVGAIGGIVDLARVETLLAIRTLPKLLMLWLLIMPVILLTWCAFSALMAWSVFAASEEVGLGMLTFFLQQVVLLLTCRWLYVKYRTRMSLPYTRAQIDNFVRSTQDAFSNRSKTKE
jgi:uncharacterized membrane protein YqjE